MDGDDEDLDEFDRWLTGDAEPPDLDVCGVEAASSRCLDWLAEGASVLRMLRRLAGHPQRDDLLEAVLLRHADQAQPFLAALEPRRPEALVTAQERSDACVGAAHLVLAVGSASAVTADDPALCYCNAAERDGAFIRYVVQSALARAEAGKVGTGISFVDGQEQTEASFGDVVSLAARRPPRTARDWATELASGERPPVRLITAADPDVVAKEAEHWFETSLDAAIELAKLGAAPVARKLAVADPWRSIRRFTTWVDPVLRIESPLWPNVSIGHRERTALELLPLEGLSGADLLIVGHALGAVMYLDDNPPNEQSAARVLGYWERGGREVVISAGLLWADLMRLASYEKNGRWQHQDQIRGVLDRLTRRIPPSGEAWAVSAVDVLARSLTIGEEARSLVMLAAVEHAQVRAAVEDAAARGPKSEVRDQAAGVLARIDGLATPGERMGRWLADHAARAFDGLPLFPRSLTALARTWVGSTAVEETLDRCLLAAEQRFASAAQAQPGVQEELLTGRLLTELEVAFRDADGRMTVAGDDGAGTIRIDHRETVKTEEVDWGCDVALLLSAQVYEVVDLTTATLVQVKKPEVPGSGAPTDRWRIDVPQLSTLLERSDSCCYWLLTLEGSVLATPATWLWGLVHGRSAETQGSVTVHYSNVRHTAIPLRQHLAELVLGAWIGSTSPDLVAFARGQDVRNQPRHILEISVARQDG